ncbi:MAG: methyltransferase, partial [Bacteroidota bacterium]|nr:methyltransferase [Bacteroidota bacterium]
MKKILEQIFSLILPVTVLIVIPYTIENNLRLKSIAALIAGIILMGLGLYLMVVTISMFIRIGKGTLAPWSPTKKLVVSGIYAYVRNPMILGVQIILTGEALALMSRNILEWDLAFFIINNIYFSLLEEPLLKYKFGKEYNAYKKYVPRWIPRLTPYKP